MDTFIPPIDMVWPLTDALSIRAQSAARKLVARNKVKIPYCIPCSLDGLELHVQRAGVQLVSQCQKERGRRQNRVVFLQCVQHCIGKNRLVPRLIRERIVLTGADQKSRPVLVTDIEIALTGKQVGRYGQEEGWLKQLNRDIQLLLVK